MSDKAPAKLRNRITATLWAVVLLPVIGAALAATLSLLGIGYQIMMAAIHGQLTLPALPSIPATWHGVIILGAVAVPGLLLWILIRYTYGSSFVDESVDSGLDTVDDAQDQLGDD